jgi:hypothetical protein
VFDSGTNPSFGVMTSHNYSFVGLGLEGFKVKNTYAAPISSHKYSLELRNSDDKIALTENPQ